MSVGKVNKGALGEAIPDLRALTWAAVDALDKSGPDSAANCLLAVRSELARRNLPPDCHCGRKDLATDPEAIVEWFAGQGLAIVDAASWFAMNSWINCAEKFLGPRPGGGQ